MAAPGRPGAAVGASDRPPAPALSGAGAGASSGSPRLALLVILVFRPQGIVGDYELGVPPPR